MGTDFYPTRPVPTLRHIVTKNCRWFLLLIGATPMATAQATKPWPDQPGVYFPQVPPAHTWRKSIGVVFTTTPPALTEEVQLQVPAVDFNIQRALGKHLHVTGRVQTQFLQTNVGIGLRGAMPITNRLSVSAGYDLTSWYGFLPIKNVFNSQAYGIQTVPNISVGYRLARDLQITAKSEVIINQYYWSKVGALTVAYNQRVLNGGAFTFVIEQPFYKKQVISLGLRAAYLNYNWQFWSLYSTFDRYTFYPQIIFGFVL